MTVRAAFKSPPPTLSFLIADPEHAPVVAKLYADAFANPWSVADIEALLMAETAIALYATMDAGRKPVGFVIGRLAGDDSEIVTIGVAPGYQRRGIGQEILAAYERASQRANADRVVFEVSAKNTAACALYHAAGYGVLGERKAYYRQTDGATCDALLLGKALPPLEADA
ncbi:MAG: GNAT family N-acetyltransferase [Pseudomonadota bacterium]